MMKGYLDPRQNTKFIMPWYVVFLLPSQFHTLWIGIKVEEVWFLRLSSGSSAGEPFSGRTYKIQELLYVAPYLTVLYPAFWKRCIYVFVFTFQNIIFLRSIERDFFEIEDIFFSEKHDMNFLFSYEILCRKGLIKRQFVFCWHRMRTSSWGSATSHFPWSWCFADRASQYNFSNWPT